MTWDTKNVAYYASIILDAFYAYYTQSYASIIVTRLYQASASPLIILRSVTHGAMYIGLI